MTARRLRLVLYSRPRCHLCDVAKDALQPLLERYPVDLVERNVEETVEWEELYGQQVPVGLLEGRRVFKYRVDVVGLERALRGRMGG